MGSLHKILFLLFCFNALVPSRAAAQEKWASPETAEMYRQAQEYMAMKNYHEAVIIYNHVLGQEPGKATLYKELGMAQHLYGNDEDAEKTLRALPGNAATDAAYFELLAVVQAAQNKMKEARATIRKGYTFYSGSGLLYDEAAKIAVQGGDSEEALQYWLSGIEADPLYAPSYYSAARTYLRSGDVLWGLVYAEMYLDIPHDTSSDDELKKLLFDGYKKMFDNSANAGGLQNGKNKRRAASPGFKEQVSAVYTPLFAVIADGNNAENLTMLRARFIIDWFPANDKKYPFSLFRYQDIMIRNGYFDMYNQWLFGKASNSAEYDAWNKFHDGDMARFKEWKNAHPLIPLKSDFYNDKDTKAVFRG